MDSVLDLAQLQLTTLLLTPDDQLYNLGVFGSS